MALIESCVGDTGDNTGYECGKALGPLAGVIMVPASAKWEKSDMDDFAAFIQVKMHAVPSQRWYPVFSDLVNMEPTKEADNITTFASGSTKMNRLGAYTMTLSFSEGGECLAKALLSFNKKGYKPILVDTDSQFKVRKNSDGTYSGLNVYDMYSPGPDVQTFDAPFLNKIYMSISVKEFVQSASIFKNDTDITDLLGLLDVEATQTAAATTTVLKVGFKTICGGTDLYDDYADELAFASAFVVKEGATVITPSGVAKDTVNHGWSLTVATQTSGDILVVSGSSAAAWETLGVVGYEPTQSVTITIP